MSQSQQSKMISVSDAINSVFDKYGCQKEFDHICPICHEKIYHTFNNKEGADRIDFYTMCTCKEKQYEQEALDKLKNNRELIIKNNKARCGFALRDKDEVSTAIKTHKGNIKAYNKLIDYANKFSSEIKMGFYIYGQVGVGKSLFAKKVLTILLNREFKVYFTNVSKLMQDIKKDLGTYSRETYQYACDVDLLVIDDLGAERTSEYDLEQLFSILESRWSNYKPIIFTSNLSPQELKTRYDKYGRIYSRIFASCPPLEIKDIDHRTKGVTF